MNRVYSLVWNRALRILQVASEVVPTKGGGAIGAAGPSLRKHPLALSCMAALAMGAVALPGWSAPVCPVGSTSISGTGHSGTSGSAGKDGANGASGQNGPSGGAPGGPGGTGGPGAAGASGGSGANGYTFGGARGPSFCIDTGSVLVGGNGGRGGSGGWGGNGGYGGKGADGTWGGNGGDGGRGGWGGNGGAGGYGGNGGAGVAGSGFSLTNAGYISGGFGGYGGAGGYGGMGGNGGHGGYGSKYGADGFRGYAGSGGNGGRGGDRGLAGAGVSGSNFFLANEGSIVGGYGGAGGTGGAGGRVGIGPYGHSGYSGPAGAGQPGAAGVVSTGNSSIINAGSIAGGLVGHGPTRADAVALSGGGNTLMLENGYQFVGNVISRSGAANGGDTLALGGDTAGTFNLAQVVAAPPTNWNGTVLYSGFNNFEKTGSSTWIVAGQGAMFHGDIDVADGTLQVGDGSTATSISGGALDVANGATLSGFGTVGASMATIEDGATLSPGDGAGGIGTLAIDGPLNMLGNLDIGIDGTGSGQFDLLDVTGAATFGTSSFFNFALDGDANQHVGDAFQFLDADAFLNFADASGNFSCSGLLSGLSCMLGMNSTGNGLVLTLDPSSVPEPGSLGMLGLGLLLLGGGLGWRERQGGKNKA